MDLENADAVKMAWYSMVTHIPMQPTAIPLIAYECERTITGPQAWISFIQLIFNPELNSSQRLEVRKILGHLKCALINNNDANTSA